MVKLSNDYYGEFGGWKDVEAPLAKIYSFDS